MTAIGALIMTLFGGVWCAVALFNARSLHGWEIVLVAVPILLLAGAALVIQRRVPQLPANERERVGRLVGRASMAEGIAIPAGIVVLNLLHLGEYVAPLIALIVGLHFLPLAKGLPASSYYVTAAALFIVASFGATVHGYERRNLLVGISAGLILWITSAWVLISVVRRQKLI